MRVLVTFDIEDASEDEREAAYIELKKLGLSRLSENKQLRLPYTTVFGEPDPSLGTAAPAIGKSVAAIIRGSTGRDPKRLAVAIVSGWYVAGQKDSDIELTELLVEFGLVD